MFIKKSMIGLFLGAIISIMFIRSAAPPMDDDFFQSLEVFDCDSDALDGTSGALQLRQHLEIGENFSPEPGGTRGRACPRKVPVCIFFPPDKNGNGNGNGFIKALASLCFEDIPTISCTLTNDCVVTQSPAVRCLDLESTISQNAITVCSGTGIIPSPAQIACSGISCLQNADPNNPPPPAVPDSLEERRNLLLTTHIQICMNIPITFDPPFGDIPIIQATYQKVPAVFGQNQFCIKDTPLAIPTENPCGEFLLGYNTTVLLGANIFIQNVSGSSADLTVQLLYLNCIFLKNLQSDSQQCFEILNEAACEQQKIAIECIITDAGTRLGSSRFNITAEGVSMLSQISQQMNQEGMPAILVCKQHCDA